MTRPAILLIGKNGQVGWELQHALAPLGAVTALDFPEINLAQPDSIREAVRRISPTLIVNAAAYTDVDKAEKEPELAKAVNETAVGVLADEAKKLDATIIHYSTDYVFDGSKKNPYTEDDIPNPLSVYGKTKLGGEMALQDSGARYIILRLSWVYGLRGRNFLLTMLRLARQGVPIRMVSDQVGTPTWSKLIALSTAHVAHRCISTAQWSPGAYHVAASSEVSRFGFVEAAFGMNAFGIPAGVSLTPISTAEYPTPALRPIYTTLCSEKARRTFGVALPGWREQLAAVAGCYVEDGRGVA